MRILFSCLVVIVFLSVGVTMRNLNLKRCRRSTGWETSAEWENGRPKRCGRLSIYRAHDRKTTTLSTTSAKTTTMPPKTTTLSQTSEKTTTVPSKDEVFKYEVTHVCDDYIKQNQMLVGENLKLVLENKKLLGEIRERNRSTMQAKHNILVQNEISKNKNEFLRFSGKRSNEAKNQKRLIDWV